MSGEQWQAALTPAAEAGRILWVAGQQGYVVKPCFKMLLYKYANQENKKPLNSSFFSISFVPGPICISSSYHNSANYKPVS